MSERIDDLGGGPELVLGINTCFAVKRWPQPEQWAARLAEFGVEEVQLSMDLLPFGGDLDAALGYAERAARAVSAAGLRLHSMFTGLAAYSSPLLLSDDPGDRRAAETWYGEMIRVAAAAGAHGAGGHVGALSSPAVDDPRRRDELHAWQIEAMLRLAEIAAAEGLDHLQFENLAVTREYGHSIAEAHELELRLADAAVPWLLCLDLGHPPALPASTGSSDPEQWLRESWAHTPVLQLQQSPSGADHHGPFTEAANRAGAVRREPVIELLRGWQAERVPMFLEVIHAHEAPDELVLDELRQSVDYWREGLAGRG